MLQPTLERINIFYYKLTTGFALQISRGGGIIVMAKPNLNLKTIIIKEVELILSETLFEYSLVKLKSILPLKIPKVCE